MSQDEKPTIDPLGDGLRVVIRCESTSLHSFLSFAAWYSFAKNMPDAHVLLSCCRPSEPRVDAFRWAYRLGVPVFYRSNPGFEIAPDVMCLGPLDDASLHAISAGKTVGEIAIPAKSDAIACLCSLSGGVGTFLPSRWEGRGGHPFGRSDHYARGPLTVNEVKIFSLWRRMCSLYESVT